MKIKTWLPLFPGFYGTIWEPDLSNLEYDDEENYGDIDYYDYFDNSAYETAVAKAFTSEVEDILKDYVKCITFEAIYSPKEYNFANDSIHVEVVPKINAIKKFVKEHYDLWCDYLRSHYKSYDGFFSSYSYFAEDWPMTVALQHQHQLGAVLQFICEQIVEEDGDIDMYYRCEVYPESYYNSPIPEIKEYAKGLYMKEDAVEQLQAAFTLELDYEKIMRDVSLEIESHNMRAL